ncbi:MAG: glycosyltransferase family 1 protein [Candidatus Saccharibacteria bacterium]
MRIAIDLRPLQIGHQNRGIGAYLLNILARLPEDGGLTYIFIRYDNSNPIKDYKIKVPGNYEEVLFKNVKFSKKPIEMIRYGLNGLVQDFGKVRKTKPDAFYQCDYLLGTPNIRGCKNIIVAHDIIPIIFKGLYLPKWSKFIYFRHIRIRSRVRLVVRSWYYEVKYKKAVANLKKANLIISVSNNTKNDLVKVLGIEESRIKVVYSAASFIDSKDEINNNTRNALETNKELPTFCYIGATDARRQIGELIYGFNLYNARIGPIKLILCGNEFSKGSKEISLDAKNAIERCSYRENLFCLGKINDSEKKLILEKSNAFIYPTLYEGFGLPLLEAMASGTDVISYKNSSITEIAGDFPTYVNGSGGYEIFLAIKDFIESKTFDNKNELTGQERAALFSWDKCAKETWSLIYK